MNMSNAPIIKLLCGDRLRKGPLPQLEPEKFGFKKEPLIKTLTPVTIPIDNASVPDYVLKLMKCGCTTHRSCA